MRHGSLFSGMGGFDLAAQWMGWENVFHCEWNPFGQKILNYYWPKAISYADITKTDFSIHRGDIDILTGGFPCQPYSVSGQRKGKEDERHLWPHMLRAIREIKPRWVVGENVLGLVSWNGGMVFEEVQADLEAEGYEVQPYILPAASVNAPHRRDRVWFVAHATNNDRRRSQSGRSKTSEWILCKPERFSIQRTITRTKQIASEWAQLKYIFESPEQFCKAIPYAANPGVEGLREQENCTNKPIIIADSESERGSGLPFGEEEKYSEHGIISENGSIANSDGLGLRGQSDRVRESRFFNKEGKIYDWSSFPTQSPICDGNDGFSTKLDGITFSKWRNE
jgi:DNA (cytosine-5)-methyltransferase 1